MNPTDPSNAPGRPGAAVDAGRCGFGPGVPVAGMAGHDAASLPFPPPGPDQVQALDILGADDRVRITDTHRPPWCQVCHLVIENQRGQQVTGTGWLGGPRTVYTAAHNLLEDLQRHAARRVTVIPGRLGNQAPHGMFEAASFATHPQWRGEQPQGADLGVIWLDQDVGRALGWMGFKPLAHAQLLNLAVLSGGYPDDRNLGTPIGTPMACEGRIAAIHAQMLAYALDTRPGQSGSPVFVRDPQGRASAVGVHAYGSPVGNHAVRLDAAAVAQLTQWWR